MFKFINSVSILLLLFAANSLVLNKVFVNAEEDAIEEDEMYEQDDVEDEDEDDEGLVEDEDEEEEDDDDGDEAEIELDDDESGDADVITSHKDVVSAVLFESGSEPYLLAGKETESYIHFANGGSDNFIINSIDASFRYPQDFSYIMQNFSILMPNKMIDAGKEGSFKYLFKPGELAGGRSFGLVVNVNYADMENNFYKDAVFNQTVLVLENDDSVDAETFFMYIMLAGMASLLVFGVYSSVAPKSKRSKKSTSNGTSPLETGTANGDVDMSWIPEQTLKVLKNKTPTSSPRSRKRTKPEVAE